MTSPIFAVMGTVFLGRILNELARIIWVPPFTVPGFLKGTVKLGDIVITVANITVIVVSIAIVILLQLFLISRKQERP